MGANIQIEGDGTSPAAPSCQEQDVPINERTAPVIMKVQEVQSRRTLFDCIPEEVQMKIASAIVVGHRSPHLISKTLPPDMRSALNFSALCAKKEDVIRHALSFKMIFTDVYSSQDDEAMLLIMGNKARKLDISLRKYRALPRRINVNNLRGAKIRSKLEHLNLIRKAEQLKALSIHIEPDVSWDHLATIIGSIAIEELALDLVEFQDLSIVQHHLFALQTAWTEVKKLKLMGLMHRRNENFNLWSAILRLPKLESLYCQERITEVLVPFLKTLKEVDIQEQVSVRNAARIGRSMRTIWDSHRLSGQDVRLLSLCPSVTDLNLRIVEGAEAELARVVENLENLELTWGGWEAGLNPPADKELYEPDGNLVLQIVRRSPKLKHLVLRGAKLETDVIVKILEITGSTLTSIFVHMGHSHEEFVKTLQAVLEGAANYCTKIQYIYPIEIDYLWPVTTGELHLPKEIVKRCCRAMLLVKRASPSFYRDILWILVTDFCPNSEEDFMD